MTPETRVGRGLTMVAIVLAGLFGLVAVMFTVGETLADPGGWPAAGLIALWLAPLVVLLVLALGRPRVAETVLEAFAVVWVAAAGWSVVAPHAWRTFEDTSGPVRAVACLALILPVVALGWHRPLPAGVMLLVVGLTSLLAVGSAPLQVMAMPTVVIGAVLLTAGLVGQGHHDTSATEPSNRSTPHPV